MITEAIRDLLVASGAADARHTRRSLLDHLLGTFDLLRCWGAPDRVCLAGLFHSIYGTAVYHHASLPFSERERVRDVIGDEAERLAYLFCVADRPRELVQGGAMISDRHTGRPHVLATAMADLREIEAANLLDQGGAIEGLLRRLLLLGVSDKAQDAIRSVLPG